MKLDTKDAYRDMMCNPYAADFLLGKPDPEIPEGWDDLYTEYVYTPSVPITPGVRIFDILQFDENFVARAVKGNGNFLIRFRDVDGDYISDDTVASSIAIGDAMFPGLIVPEWFIPQGRYIGIEIIGL